MLKRIVLALCAMVILALMVASIVLLWAHAAIRGERPALPTAETVVGALGTTGPVRLSYINTASQEMPRASVLDQSLDPWPKEPYMMSHASFVLEWADGRILLVDTGMTREGAESFGRPIEYMGGKPIVPHGSVAETLGADRKRVYGAVFTHLHTDHVGGIADLCKTAAPIRVYMTAAQAERPNYTTRPGLHLLHESPCVQIERLPNTTLAPLAELPGVYVIAAGGHTPGSQIIIAAVQTAQGTRRYAFVGDIVNNIDGITYNVPKPFWYSLLVVPEDRERLDELRRWLRNLRDNHGVQLLVAHDQRAIEQSGISAWK